MHPASAAIRSWGADDNVVAAVSVQVGKNRRWAKLWACWPPTAAVMLLWA